MKSVALILLPIAILSAGPVMAWGHKTPKPPSQAETDARAMMAADCGDGPDTHYGDWPVPRFAAAAEWRYLHLPLIVCKGMTQAQVQAEYDDFVASVKKRQTPTVNSSVTGTHWKNTYIGLVDLGLTPSQAYDVMEAAGAMPGTFDDNP